MILPRRDFLKMLGVAAGAAGVGGCGRNWLVPDRLVEEALRGPGLESQLQTICGLCEGGCGLTVRLVDGMPCGIKGNVNHPLNRGGLCPVGQAGLEVLYSPARTQGPLWRNEAGEQQATGWDEALSAIGEKLAALRSAGQADRIVVLTEEPGQLFWDLAERFAAALGSPNLAHLSRPASLAFELTQGLGAVPGFDLAATDLLLSFGLDVFEDGPAPMQAISAMIGQRPIEERARLIQVGTRLSPSAAKAERFVGVRPSTHGAFALGVAHVLVREGHYDRDFIAEHADGFEDWQDAEGDLQMGFRRLLLERYYPDRVGQLCGCAPSRVVDVARRFASADRPLAVAGGEAGAGTNGTWNLLAVHALNALMGSVDRAGGVVLPPPIPLTPLEPVGKPAAESFFAGADPVDRLAEQVLEESGSVEVLFLLNANPVHSSPAGARLAEAIERIPMVISTSSFPDETSVLADYVLPAHVFLEGWNGSTTPPGVAFSSLGIGRPVIEPLFDTRHPADVLIGLAGRVAGGMEAAIPWSSYEDYLKARVEGLVVSGEGSVVSGSFEESWVHFLEERGWRFLEHKSLEDFWSDLVEQSAWWNPVRAEGDWARLLSTPSGRFEFAAGALAQKAWTETGDEARLPHFEAPVEEGEGELVLVPFRPITGRGGVAAASPMLMEMYGLPFFTEWQTWVELAPETAHELHLHDGDEVAVESDRAAVEAVVRVQPGAVAGVAHMPLGLGHREGFGAGGGIGSNPNLLLASTHDTLAGSRATASTRVRLRLMRRRPHGGPAPLSGGHG